MSGMRGKVGSDSSARGNEQFRAGSKLLPALLTWNTLLLLLEILTKISDIAIIIYFENLLFQIAVFV